GGLQVARERLDASQVALDVVEETQTRLPDGLSVEVVVPPEAPRVLGDRDKTKHVLTNLLDNAIKYSPSGGRIEVAVAPGREFLRVTVSDEGLGIPPGEQARIFEKFYRLDAAMSRGVGGSGLGLYISREIVEQMGGTLSVRSSRGVGSTFSVTLPCARVGAGLGRALSSRAS